MGIQDNINRSITSIATVSALTSIAMPERRTIRVLNKNCDQILNKYSCFYNSDRDKYYFTEDAVSETDIELIAPLLANLEEIIKNPNLSNKERAAFTEKRKQLTNLYDSLISYKESPPADKEYRETAEKLVNDEKDKETSDKISGVILFVVAVLVITIIIIVASGK